MALAGFDVVGDDLDGAELGGRDVGCQVVGQEGGDDGAHAAGDDDQGDGVALGVVQEAGEGWVEGYTGGEEGEEAGKGDGDGVDHLLERVAVEGLGVVLRWCVGLGRGPHVGLSLLDLLPVGHNGTRLGVFLALSMALRFASCKSCAILRSFQGGKGGMQHTGTSPSPPRRPYSPESSSRVQTPDCPSEAPTDQHAITLIALDFPSQAIQGRNWTAYSPYSHYLPRRSVRPSLRH